MGEGEKVIRGISARRICNASEGTRGEDKKAMEAAWANSFSDGSRSIILTNSRLRMQLWSRKLRPWHFFKPRATRRTKGVSHAAG